MKRVERTLTAMDVIKEAREAEIELVLYGGVLSMHGPGKVSPELLASAKTNFNYIVALLKKQHKWIDGGQRMPWGLDRPIPRYCKMQKKAAKR